MRNFLFRVYYDEPEGWETSATIEVTGAGFFDAFNQALTKLSPHQKQYLFGMQAFVQCDPFDPDAPVSA